MARAVDPNRRCLPVRYWPARDQALWTKVLQPRDLEDEDSGRASDWKPGSVQTNREGYGRWINFLQRSAADMTTDAVDRVTPERVSGYVAELAAQGLALQTRANRISQLMSVMMAFAPDRDWSRLKARFNHLAALAGAERSQPPLQLFSGDLLDKSIGALRRLQRAGFNGSFEQAILFRNWLMVATGTLAPLRRHNLAGVRIGTHLRRGGAEWSVEIPAVETKTGKRISMPIPRVLHPFIHHYIEVIRPVLLAGQQTDRLWITNCHTPMADHSFYIALTNFTRSAFGIAINPHKLRHTGATSTVIAAPEKIESARAFMTHGDRGTTETFYVIGQSLAASRQHAAMIAKLRRHSAGIKQPRRKKTVSPKKPATINRGLLSE
jgi:integrase/recombinase XerD